MLGEFDQAAEPALLLGLVIGEDFGQAVIEKRIGEPLDHGLEISLRLVSHADRREHRQHFFGVERVKLRAHRCVRHRLADRQARRAALFGPNLGEIGVAEIENEQLQSLIGLEVGGDDDGRMPAGQFEARLVLDRP